MRRSPFIADERGVAAVIVVLAMPVLLLIGVISIDVANWFVHKRQLQTRADAAALAGAGMFSFPNCDNAAIRAKANEYSGKVTYNAPKPSVTPQARLHAEVNEANFFNQTTPNDAGLPDDPCDTLYVDVKMTENDLPWFFGSGLVPNINAQARVQLFKATIAEGLLPVGVQDAVPKRVRAWVVDELDGSEIPGSGIELASLGAAGTLQHFANATPATFNVPDSTATRLGVRVALSGSSSTTSCGAPLVSCYDSQATTHGLSFIRTYPDPPTLASNASPVALSVSLSPGSCGNASFNSSATDCDFDVNAKVKWNADAVLTGAVNVSTLTLKINGQNPGHPMTYSAGTDTWNVSDLEFPRDDLGTAAISIGYKQRGGQIGTQNCTGGNRCEGTFGNVQRTFWNVPDDQASHAGPIARFDILNATPGPTLGQQVSDLHRCTGPTGAHCTASLTYDIKIKGSLDLSDPADVPISLRVDANQSQSLQCDPDAGGTSGLEEMLARGCPDPYIPNSGQTCPNKTTLWASTPPWMCVAIRTGEPPNSTARGLNQRILCNTAIDGATAANNCTPSGGATDCTHPNRWPRGGPAPTSYEGDPRVVDVFVTPFGTFSGTGADETVPVIKAGRFYITGYTAQGGLDTPCADNSGPGGSQDVYSTYPADPPAGNISGHFIKGLTPNGGGATNDVCDLTEVGNCVAVLVK